MSGRPHHHHSYFGHHLKMLGQALLGRRKSLVKKNRNFTDGELKDLRTAFDLLDRDRDGHVTPDELQFMLHNLGININDELIDGLMKDASETGNGLIDETEFLQWIGRIQALREDSTSLTQHDDLTQDLVAAFRVFDQDNNGYITRDELKNAMQILGEEVTENQLTDMLALADLDKDGRIDYEEFVKLLL